MSYTPMKEEMFKLQDHRNVSSFGHIELHDWGHFRPSLDHRYIKVESPG